MAGAWGTLAFGVFMVVRSSAAGPPSGRDTGIIEGHVSYHGEIPAPTIVMEGGSTQHVLYVSRNGGLQYAVAFLSEAAAAAPTEQDPPTLRQSSFIFEPQVLAVREGQPVRFTNEDGANHNVRSDDADPPNRFSLYTGAGQMQSRRFRANGGHRPLHITCDIHPWMVAWIYAFAHPYFAVTDQTGHFRITDVRPGLRQLSIRQPAGGLERDLRVQVTAGGVAHVQVRFTASELSAPRARSLEDGSRER
jgi:plastocyanin